MQDIRFALRLIATGRWFSAAVVVTLALGIGINTTVFTLVNAVLFKPVPFPDGERLVAIGNLTARINLKADGPTVRATGRFAADIIQSCAVSGEDLATTIDEPLALRFVPEVPVTAEELELDSEALDEIPYTGGSLELGEAVAQSLALAIDPYAIGPEAERVRKEAGLQDEAASGPFAALAALKKDA